VKMKRNSILIRKSPVSLLAEMTSAVSIETLSHGQASAKSHEITSVFIETIPKATVFMNTLLKATVSLSAWFKATGYST
jgi:hypothetical protein